MRQLTYEEETPRNDGWEDEGPGHGSVEQVGSPECLLAVLQGSEMPLKSKNNERCYCWIPYYLFIFANILYILSLLKYKSPEIRATIYFYLSF